MTNIGTNLELESHEISYSPDTGVRTLLGYEGTRDAVVGYAFQLPYESNWRTSDSDKPKCRLDVSFPYLFAGQTVPEQPIDSWETPTSTIQNDYREHPNFLGLSAPVRRVIDIGLEDISKNATPENVLAKDNTVREAIAFYSALSSGTQVDRDYGIPIFAYLLKNPNPTYQVSQVMLRHTRIIGTVVALQVATGNVHKIYTRAQIDVEDPIPTEYKLYLDTIPVVVPHTGFFWGWLKQNPSVEKVAYGKLKIVTEWWLAEWAKFFYPTI